ncbi:leucine-rich repeat domain-containing protein [Ruminococcus sp.]|uniref:leucine-rich repeat domain-containing protein n=1 Tax=Ruminococcus sp. TaxID=41978 RepID=UPI001B17CB35|nr:leucine-rich repeat domain-containing protein [Ruminococcus sp.]MBO5557301.1 leucine-rich repeat domain-containing protein [Ruminococcus sp.]
MKNKRLVAGLLALTFVFGGAALPTGVVSNNTVISASAEELTYGNFTYTMLEDGTIEISKYTGSETAVEIPSEIDGVAVTSIGDYSFINCIFTSVVIPDSITNIGKEAFRGCNKLIEVTIPNSVETLGEHAFSGCVALESVVISKNLTAINYGTFYGCKKLTSITLPYGITSVGSTAFSGCTSLKNIDLPDSVTTIDSHAFYNCTALKNINIPNGVLSLGDSAFNTCTSLESLVLPNGMTSIGERAFYECTKLASISMPDSITSIGAYAFQNCVSLAKVKIPAGVTRIAGYTFNNCDSLTNVTIPDGVERLEGYSFSNLDNLAIITIPESVTSIVNTLFVNSNQSFRVYCYNGSYAENYSLKNKINFRILDLQEPTDYPMINGIDFNKESHQFRLKWTPVEGASEYGIATQVAGKWRVQAQKITATSFTSPKNLTPNSTYKIAIAAKVNGVWDTENAIKNAVTVK